MTEPDSINLKDYVETRFNLILKNIESIESRFDERIKEADLRYEQRFRAQMDATTKADMASEKRFEAVNEFRKTLTDQTSTFVPRNEYSQSILSLSDRIGKVETLASSRESRISGAQENRTSVRSDISVWIALIVMVVGIVAIFLKK
jgi:hypothetical protein